MLKGVLWKCTSTFVSGMERRFCVLVSSLMLEFESEDDFLCGSPPKSEAEIIGVSTWKGKSRPRGAHKEGFVFVTRLGRTHYCCVTSADELQDWMRWLRTALDMALGTQGVGIEDPHVAGVSISREALHRGVLEPPKPSESEVCSKSGAAFGLTQSRYNCCSCGGAFILDHCSRKVPLPHHGFEEAVRVCDNCLEAQQLLAHLRFLSCVLAAHLHQRKLTRRGERLAVVRSLGTKSEEGKTKKLCNSVEVGLNLLERGELNEEEFGGLVKAEEGFQRDEAYNRVHAGCLSASARLGDSTLAVVGLLHKGAASAPADEFRAVVLHLRMLAERDLDSIDFFWPQVIHAFYLLVPTVSAEGIFKAELLEDFIMSMALRSTHLAVKLVWWLKGYVEDLARETAANSGKGTAGKQAHLVRLAVEVEDMVLSRAEHVLARKRRRRRTHEKPFNRSTTQHQHQQLGQECDTPKATTRTNSSSVGGGGEGFRITPDGKRGEGALAEDVEKEEEEASDTEGSRSLSLERRLLATLVRPTGAQSSLVADELLLLRALRAAAAEHLGLDYVAKKTLFDDAVWDHGCGDDGEGDDQGLAQARYFEEQLTFAQELVDIAERLRFVEPVSSRGDRLKEELIALEDDGDGVTERNDDFIGAGDDVITNESKNQDQEGSSSSCAPVADDDVGSSNKSGCDGAMDMTEKDGNGDDNHPDPRSPRKVGDGGGKLQEAVTEAEAGEGARAEAETGVVIPGDVEVDGKGGGGKVNNSHRRRRGERGCGTTTAGGVRGYLPVCRATDPICPIVRIPPSEGHVFKTKQRAPTLVTCEIVVPKVVPVRTRMITPSLAREGRFDKMTMLVGGGGGGEVAVACGQRRIGEGLEGVKDGREGQQVTVGSSGGGGGGGRARMMKSISRRRMENLRASTASPLNVERRSLPGSGREEVEEMIGSQVEPQGSLARSISDREDPVPPTESPSCRKREIRQLLENSDTLLEAQRRPEGWARDADADATPLESAVPVDVEAAFEVHSGFQENEAFISGVDDMVTEGQRSQRPQPRVTAGTTESQVQGSMDPPRVDEAETGAGGSGGRGDRDGDGDDNIPSLSSTSQEIPVVSDEGGGGGLRSNSSSRSSSSSSSSSSNITDKTNSVGSNGRDGSSGSSNSSRGGGGETFTASSEQELQAVKSLEGNADAASAPSSIDGADKRGAILNEQQDQRKTSDVVEDALRLHRGHQMLRRSPLSKEPVINRSRGGGFGANEGGHDGGESGRKYSAELRSGLISGEGAESGGGADRCGGGRAGDAASNDSRVKVGNGVSSDFAEALARRAYLDPRGEAGLLEKVEREGGKRDESVAICRARALFDEGLISEEELEAVVSKDKAFTEVVEQHAFLDVQFCVSQAFGESWANKRARIKAASAWGNEPGWDLVSIIIKSNDDLRQEVCALQLIGLCKRIFEEAGLDLFLQPYVIVSTGSSSGLVQCLTDAISVDSLKKKPNFVSLRDHFEKTYGNPSSKRFLEAQRNFVNSLAAYSLACYVLQIKDRHNGNILLDAEGRLIHIDFGFILGMAPGGNFALETCPFKLPTDYLDVMGGLESQGFMDLVVAFTCGFLTLQAHVGRFVKLLGMMTQKSPFPCFQGKDSPENIVKKLSDRLMPHLDKSETVAFCLDLIRESYNNYGQRQYDYYQWLTNGIVT